MGMAKTRLARNKQDSGLVRAWYHVVWDHDGMLTFPVPQWLSGKITIGGITGVTRGSAWAASYLSAAGKTRIDNNTVIVDQSGPMPLFMSPSGFEADWEPIEPTQGEIVPLNRDSLDRLGTMNFELSDYGCFTATDESIPVSDVTHEKRKVIASRTLEDLKKLDELILAGLDRFSTEILVRKINERGHVVLTQKQYRRLLDESKALQSLREAVWGIARQFDQGIEEAASAAEQTYLGVDLKSGDGFSGRKVYTPGLTGIIDTRDGRRFRIVGHDIAETRDEAQGQDASSGTQQGQG
jgi:hypothetical protein